MRFFFAVTLSDSCMCIIIIIISLTPSFISHVQIPGFGATNDDSFHVSSIRSPYWITTSFPTHYLTHLGDPAEGAGVQ